MSLEIPETVVLGITTHGAIPIEDSEVKTFEVPSGMTITKVSLAAIGVCNLTTEDEVETASRIIGRVFQNTQRPIQKNIDLATFVVFDLHKELQKEVDKDVKSGLIKDPNFQEFIRYSDKPQTQFTYTTGQKLIDKVFMRSVVEGMASPYDYKINMLNVTGKPDLVKLLTTGRTVPSTRASVLRENTPLFFSDIVEFLESKGVKQIVVFDFSCSVMEEGTPRDVRVKRRRLEKEGLSGGKTRKRRNKKTKTRRAKKRRT